MARERISSKLFAVLLVLTMLLALVPITASATYPSASGAGFDFQFGDPNPALEELSPEKDMVFTGTAPTFTANYSGDLNNHTISDQTTYYPSVLAFYVTSGVQNIGSITATGLTYVMYDADDTTHTPIANVALIPSSTTKLGFALTLDEASTTTVRRLEITSKSNQTLTVDFNQPHIYLLPITASMPTALKGYLPVGQFATGAGWGSPFTNSNASAGINAGTSVTRKIVNGYVSTGISLGAAGGYVEYDFALNKYQTDENNVKTRIKRPYGVDFIVYGNAFVNNPEAGSVKVHGTTTDSKTGWFELAGSLYYNAKTLRDVNVSYKKVVANDNTQGIYYKIEKGTTVLRNWTKFNTNTNVAWWPEDTEGYYDCNNIPGVYGNVEDVIFDFANDVITYQHVTIVRDNDTTSGYAFGYFDITPNGTVSTTAVNPYVYGTSGGNGYSLDWAVDENGNPVDISTIDKIRLYTSAGMDENSTTNEFTVPSIFGETSAELCGVFAATGTATDSPATTTIEVNGMNVNYYGITPTYVGGVAIYNLHGAVTTSGTVSASGPSNIYLNETKLSTTVTSINYDSTTNYVRVIAQSGDAAPIIVYLKF